MSKLNNIKLLKEKENGNIAKEERKIFESKTSLNNALVEAGYILKEEEKGKWVIFDQENKKIGLSLSENDLYKYFFESKNINYSEYNTKKWLPDDCFIDLRIRKAYVIEQKFQSIGGSTDEKLANCEFKKMMYKKLFSLVGFEVEYVYIFNDWFKDPKYHDVLHYIMEKGCYYFFNQVPLTLFNL